MTRAQPQFPRRRFRPHNHAYFQVEDVLEAYELHHLQDEGAVKIVIDMEG